MTAGLTAVNLNVYPYNQATVVDYEGGNAGTASVAPQLSNWAVGTGSLTHSDAGALTAYPATGSGGTAGVYTPGNTYYVAGFLDGEQRARLFYTDGSTIGLPILKSITQTQYTDTVSTKGGGFKIVLTPNSANLIDATSPMTFYLDGYAILILAGTQYG